MQDRVENYNNLQAESGQSRTRKTSKVMFEPLPPDSETFRGTDLFSTSFDDCSSSRTRVFWTEMAQSWQESWTGRPGRVARWSPPCCSKATGAGRSLECPLSSLSQNKLLKYLFMEKTTFNSIIIHDELVIGMERTPTFFYFYLHATC